MAHAMQQTRSERIGMASFKRLTTAPQK